MYLFKNKSYSKMLNTYSEKAIPVAKCDWNIKMNVCVNFLFNNSKIPYVYIILLFFKNLLNQYRGLFSIKSNSKKHKRSAIQNLRVNFFLRKGLAFYFADTVFSTFRIESKTWVPDFTALNYSLIKQNLNTSTFTSSLSYSFSLNSLHLTKLFSENFNTEIFLITEYKKYNTYIKCSISTSSLDYLYNFWMLHFISYFHYYNF